jgi:hypothetical protein
MYVYRLNRVNFPNPVGILCKNAQNNIHSLWELSQFFIPPYKHTFPTGIWVAAV